MTEASPQSPQAPPATSRRKAWGTISLILLLGACILEVWMAYRIYPSGERIFREAYGSKEYLLPMTWRAMLVWARLIDYIEGVAVVVIAAWLFLWFKRARLWVSIVSSLLAVVITAWSVMGWQSVRKDLRILLERIDAKEKADAQAK